VNINLDLLAIKKAMSKISYAALYEYFGNQFLNDPLIGEWRKVLFSDSEDEVTYAKIRGSAFLDTPFLDLIIPEIEPWEHAIVIANLQMTGPVCAVSLFGKGVHNIVTIASENSNMGLDPGQGQVVVCNAKERSVRKLDFFTEILLKRSFNPDVLNMYDL